MPTYISVCYIAGAMPAQPMNPLQGLQGIPAAQMQYLSRQVGMGMQQPFPGQQQPFPSQQALQGKLTSRRRMLGSDGQV